MPMAEDQPFFFCTQPIDPRLLPTRQGANFAPQPTVGSTAAESSASVSSIADGARGHTMPGGAQGKRGISVLPFRSLIGAIATPIKPSVNRFRIEHRLHAGGI